MSKFLLLGLFFLQSLFSSAQEEAVTSTGRRVLLFQDGRWEYLDTTPFNSEALKGLEIPFLKRNERVITHTGFSLSYSEAHEQARWVAYELTKEETNKLYERTNRFSADPDVSSETANDNDYRKSGYDRGHLAPAGDMGWSEVAMRESFYYSNISPQLPSFNRGVWKRLEEQVRQWASENEAVYVVTGPVLTDQLGSMGLNRVSVPEYFFKAVLDYRNPGVKAIAFLMPHVPNAAPLSQFVISIDSLEEVTGIDFFPLLPDNQEGRLESTVCLPCWGLEKKLREEDKNRDSGNGAQSGQCQGTTKAGNRCRNLTRNESGYCHAHVNQQDNSGSVNQESKENSKSSTPTSAMSVQCSGTTKKGAQCRRMTRNASGRCFQHGG